MLFVCGMILGTIVGYMIGHDNGFAEARRLYKREY
jgi:hypothetical protein